jgi:glycogen synthase
MNKKIKYVVAYDEVDKKIMRFFFGFKKKYFAAPLPVDSPLVKKVNKPQNFIIMSGRLHSGQKNVNFLLKMSKYLDCKIKLYGPSYPQQIEHFKKFKNVEYYGPFTHKDLTNMYKNANASILVSKFEGFGFVLAESLQNSTPIIVRNTFPASK